MPLDPTSIVPSGYYIAIIDNNGNAKIMERPTGRSLVYFDGSVFRPVDGGDAHPIVLDHIARWGAGVSGLLALDASSRVFKWAPIDGSGNPLNDGKQRFASIVNGVMTWGEIPIKGVPSTGYGLAFRSWYDQSDLGIAPPTTQLLNTPGLVYIPVRSAGVGDTPAVIVNGTDGQIFKMVNGVPSWGSLPAGTSSAGVASAGLSGVSITNTSSSAVSVSVPSLTVTKADGTDLKLTSVNVSASLVASLGPGGLDLGTENSNVWYYVYVVANGSGGISAVISTSATTPDLTNLGAYIYIAAVGVFRNDGSGNIIPFVQRGREVWTRQQVWGNNITATATINAIAGGVLLTTLVPPTAKLVQGMVGGSTTASARQVMFVAADINGLAAQVCSSDEFTGASEGFTYDCGNFRLPVVDPVSPSLYWRIHGASGTDTHRRVVITGYSI